MPFFAGLDLGQADDYSALVVLDAGPERLDLLRILCAIKRDHRFAAKSASAFINVVAAAL